MPFALSLKQLTPRSVLASSLHTAIENLQSFNSIYLFHFFSKLWCKCYLNYDMELSGHPHLP